MGTMSARRRRQVNHCAHAPVNCGENAQEDVSNPAPYDPLRSKDDVPHVLGSTCLSAPAIDPLLVANGVLW
jgi:hypothetical protein